jgi:rod shape determining protein RodA
VSIGYSPRTYLPRRRSAWARFAGRLFGLLGRLDWLLMFSALALSILGAVLVWSATRNRSHLTHGDPEYFLKRHLLNLVVGLALGALVLIVDYKILRSYVFFVYAIVLLGLIAVMTPLGSTINGAHSWIVIGGGFSLQPSEFAKLAVIMVTAMVLSERRDVEDMPADRDVFSALALAAVPMMIIVSLPDLGTTMVVVAILVGILVMSGVPNKWLIGIVVVGALGVLAVAEFHLLSQYQVNRFAAFADPKLDPAGVGYNTTQARIAIGSGGLLGKGLFHGSQTEGSFVPEQQTDFVFSVAGEELGFVGCTLVIVLFGLLLWRCARIATKAEDRFGMLVAAGVTCWFAFQAFENIGMNVGIMPVAGIPLPFVSYGGSSMFANFMAVGLLQNVHVRRAMLGPG